MSCSRQDIVAAWERQGAGAELPPALQAHVRDCAACAARVEEIRSMRRLVAELPGASLSEERAADMRARLIARMQGSPVSLHADEGEGEALSGVTLDAPANDDEETASPPARRWLWAVAAAVAAVLLMSAGFALRGWVEPASGDALERAARAPSAPPPQEAPAGVWIAEDDAQVERLSAAPNEVVWLRHGAAWFKVDPLPEGRVFRVIAGDGEVEVVGTRFRVDVERGRLRSVQVAEGRVIVRTEGKPAAELTAGQRWASPNTQARTDAETRTDADALAADAIAPDSAPEDVDAPETHAQRAGSERAVARVADEVAAPAARTRPARPRRAKRPRPALARSPKRQPRERRPSTTNTAARSAIKAPSEQPSARERPSPEPDPSAAQQPQAQPSVDERFAEAWSLYQAGRFGAASRKLDDVSRLPQQDNARRAEILYWAARAHAQSGSEQRAAEHLRRSLQLSPDGWWSDDARRLLRALTASQR